MSFYVYALKDPRTDEIFYIGKGTGLRLESTLKTDGKTSILKRAMIERIRKEGKEPVSIILEDGLSESEALILEKELIKEHGRLAFDPDGKLTNITLSGSGQQRLKKKENVLKHLKEISYDDQHFKNLVKILKASDGSRFTSIQVSLDIKEEFAKACRKEDKILSRVMDRMMAAYISGSITIV